MDRVRKTFFDPLATTKDRVREILEGLPVGSAHPFSPERILLCRTANGIDEIDTSSYQHDFFCNAVDLGEMGETLLRRMAGFQSYLRVFNEFQITQAPSSTFSIPIMSSHITILAVSERMPTYYDFCLADASGNACCFDNRAMRTFAGIVHSGDVTNAMDLLQFIRIDKDTLTAKEICVFISGFSKTEITRFQGTHPALLVADHVDKILYIIPVPLDAATVGDATICCPLVIKKFGDSLVCSILPAATTDRNKMCSSNTLASRAFPEAIQRANFTTSAPSPTPRTDLVSSSSGPEPTVDSENLGNIMSRKGALFLAGSVTRPSFLTLENMQTIKFGTGIDFQVSEEKGSDNDSPASVLLPCIFGSRLEGPVLLATGTVPSNVPFSNASALRNYYDRLKRVVVIVDDRMTDNARNLTPAYRINALFIVQLNPEMEPANAEEVTALLDSTNVNAVTALAGPQSLVLVQAFDKYYFYRGLANRVHLDTTTLAYGSDVTQLLTSVDVEEILDPRIKRIVNLEEENTILLPKSGQVIQLQSLEKLFKDLTIDRISDLTGDISAAIPQIQILLNQKGLQSLSHSLVALLSSKVGEVTGHLRSAYIEFLASEYDAANQESAKKKARMLGELRKTTKGLESGLKPVISQLAAMMSYQTTSKRTHDLKRLVRQNQIKNNVEATKTMSFDTIASYLEEYAEDMGVMLLNIDETPYRQLLGNLGTVANAVMNARPCSNLDSRILHLSGLDAGIIIEQSQAQHVGPLRNQAGPTHPIMALPNLNQGDRSGSMLAWVCWDEFVNLESPYTISWTEKCNEAHISALRIIMRDTLSQSVASREYNLQPGSPETGHLMSALLMAAMSKLAAMRTTTPIVKAKAEDTVTRLMRGLFGNLLTIAGSGVRPLSMVWQLFGSEKKLDVPTTEIEWIWYETVAQLYPYTGWPKEKFHGNLEQLLSKALIRAVTKNENTAKIKLGRTATMIEYCRLRNIQLQHSRTIITALMRMFTTEGSNMAAISSRLLGHLPEKLKRQSEGYTRMIRYLQHLAKGGHQRVEDNLVAVSVYTRRSAGFVAFKTKVAEACENREWAKAKDFSQELMDHHAQIASLWHVEPETLKFQNAKAYQELLCADLRDDVDQETKNKNTKLIKRITGDAERIRIPWQIGKEGGLSPDIEPLDEALLHELLTGEKLEFHELVQLNHEPHSTTESIVIPVRKPEDDFDPFKSSLSAKFVTDMQQDLTAEDVCGIINVSIPAMRVFVKALNPDFVWEDLGKNFRGVVLGLLQERSTREESRPARKLLNLGGRSMTLKVDKGQHGG